MRNVDRDEDAPARRWVEGVVTAKVPDRQTVVLRSPEYDGNEFSVPDPRLWSEIQVGTMGIAETDDGELVSWRSLSPPPD